MNAPLEAAIRRWVDRAIEANPTTCGAEECEIPDCDFCTERYLLAALDEARREIDRLNAELFRRGTLATEVEAAERERDTLREALRDVLYPDGTRLLSMVLTGWAKGYGLDEAVTRAEALLASGGQQEPRQ